MNFIWNMCIYINAFTWIEIDYTAPLSYTKQEISQFQNPIYIITAFEMSSENKSHLLYYFEVHYKRILYKENTELELTYALRCLVS